MSLMFSPLGFKTAIRHCFLSISVVMLISGCATAADTKPSASGVVPAKIPVDKEGIVHIDTSKPILFDMHSFSYFCYSTYGCFVDYANLPLTQQDENKLKPSSESYGPDYQKNWSGTFGSIQNFPEPLLLRWRSKDGSEHKAKIDIGQIFKDQVILHKVPQNQLKPILTAPVIPAIILEVNDRTVNVWMRAHAPTKDLQIPGNQYSNFRSDVVLAWTKTY